MLLVHWLEILPWKSWEYLLHLEEQGVDGNNDYELDIVPFGKLETDETIAWPPEGNPQMSVKCFKEVMTIADTVTIDEEFSIKIAPLAGQFLIKFDTWLDRHLLTDSLKYYKNNTMMIISSFSISSKIYSNEDSLVVKYLDDKRAIAIPKRHSKCNND